MAVPEYKIKLVKDVEELVKNYPMIGIVNMHGLPAAQLQKMKAKLNDVCKIFMVKKTLMKIAFEDVKSEKKGIEKLEEYTKGIPALIFSKENPFKLFSIIQKNKSRAAAKAGQFAPHDIEVKAGPTPFAPGPIISELGSFGLKTQVKDGKIEITQDHVVVKEDEEISGELASLLMRLGIEPMEVGLDLIAVYEDGQVFDKKILAIDEEEYKNNFVAASRWAFNLAVEAGILNETTTELLIQKAYNESKNLALEANILADGLREQILAKAEGQMHALEGQLNLPAVKKEAKEEKTEDKKEEANVESEEKKPSADAKPESVKEESKPENTDVKSTDNKEKEESKDENSDKKDDTDDKVNDMVEEWKHKDEKEPSAEDIVGESK